MIRTFRPIPLKKIKLVIFDLDGTLIDSELDLAASVNAMLRHYGRKELPIQVIGTYIGDGAPTLIRRALGDPADREFLQDALNYFLAYYRDHKLDNTYPYEGHQAGAGADWQRRTIPRKLAVLTNKPVTSIASHPRGTGTGGTLFPDLRRQQFRHQEARSLRRQHPDARGGCDGRRNRDGRRLGGGHPHRSQCRTVERRRDLRIRSANAGTGASRRAGGQSGGAGPRADGESRAARGRGCEQK